MRSKDFIGRLQHDRIVEAIRHAEAKTSGQIRIYVHRGELKEAALVLAKQKFTELGMHETKDRNAVLIYVAPRARQLAVVGDQGVHEKCGETLWQSVVVRMADHFKREQFTAAMLGAVEELGMVLATHFPPQAGGKNELPDEILES